MTVNYDEQIAALPAQIKELEAKRDGINPWMPKVGGEYFTVCVEDTGEIFIGKCINLHPEPLKRHTKAFGVLKTEAEAENRVKQLRAITKWQSIPNDFVPDWGDAEQYKCYPVLKLNTGISTTCSWTTQLFPFQYFATEKQCQRAIDWMGEESMRHLFGIFGD